MLQPEYKEFTRLAREASLVPVVKSVTADLLTPVSAFLKLSAGRDGNCFLLESVEGGDIGLGFAGAYRDPDPDSSDKGVRFRLDLAPSQLIVHQSRRGDQDVGRFAHRKAPLELRRRGKELDPHAVVRFTLELLGDFHEARLERARGEDPDIGRRRRTRDRARQERSQDPHGRIAH